MNIGSETNDKLKPRNRKYVALAFLDSDKVSKTAAKNEDKCFDFPDDLDSFFKMKHGRPVKHRRRQLQDENTVQQCRNSDNQQSITTWQSMNTKVTDHSSQLEGHDQLVPSSYELEDTDGNALNGLPGLQTHNNTLQKEPKINNGILKKKSSKSPNQMRSVKFDLPSPDKSTPNKLETNNKVNLNNPIPHKAKLENFTDSNTPNKIKVDRVEKFIAECRFVSQYWEDHGVTMDEISLSYENDSQPLFPLTQNLQMQNQCGESQELSQEVPDEQQWSQLDDENLEVVAIYEEAREAMQTKRGSFLMDNRN